eukprot:CAMPEP_0185852562 /NCGR_PEP_ID=MMETSP1354-20130828/15282_1 /TAXON_ID=708628 /ORGANISM="Erythrolobus madagascarensis, Strain CCMP3276" /LENGTH=257 /DNA_ID=CAMNT_0028553829 /DNA_START=225 /DNA_END=998 /DNA_ORIENTATION=-
MQNPSLSPRRQRLPRRSSPRPVEMVIQCANDSTERAREAVKEVKNEAEPAQGSSVAVKQDSSDSEEGAPFLAGLDLSTPTKTSPSGLKSPKKDIRLGQIRATEFTMSPRNSSRTLGLASPRTPRLRQSLTAIREVLETEDSGEDVEKDAAGVKKSPPDPAHVDYHERTSSRVSRLSGLAPKSMSRWRLEAWETKLGMSPRTSHLNATTSPSALSSPNRTFISPKTPSTPSALAGGSSTRKPTHSPRSPVPQATTEDT